MNKMLLVAVAAFVAGTTAFALTLGILANQQQTSAPAHGRLQEQVDCDALAHKAADKWIADHHSSSTSFESHMNARLGECLVALKGEVDHGPSKVTMEFGALLGAIDQHSSAITIRTIGVRTGIIPTTDNTSMLVTLRASRLLG